MTDAPSTPIHTPSLPRRLAALFALAAGGWLWWQAATVATAYLLGHNQRFQQFVIEMISGLRASGTFTLLLLGMVYVVFSLLQLLLWPRGTLQRRLGAAGLGLWAVCSFGEAALQFMGLAPYEQALLAAWSGSAAALVLRSAGSLVTALGPELLIGWAVRQWWPAARS